METGAGVHFNSNIKYSAFTYNYKNTYTLVEKSFLTPFALKTSLESSSAVCCRRVFQHADKPLQHVQSAGEQERQEDSFLTLSYYQ